MIIEFWVQREIEFYDHFMGSLQIMLACVAENVQPVVV